MSSRTVISPAEEEVEIVDDDDWCATAGVSMASLRMWSGMKPLVIRELWERGMVNNQSGKAALELMEQIRENFTEVPDVAHTSMSMLMTQPVNRACFERHTNGKRTYEISLIALPETYYRKLQLDIESFPSNGSRPESPDAGTTETLASSSLDQVDEPEVFIAYDNGAAEKVAALLDIDRSTEAFDDSLIVQPVEVDISPPLELDIASQVAMSLLTTVVEIISAGSPEAMDNRVTALHADLMEVQTRLGSRLEENQRMRNQLRQAGDDIKALTFERDGLRKRVRQLEGNLQAALKGDALSAVNGMITKKVDEIMRAAPGTKKGSDA